ncbi:MAG: YggT family protein [Candidatus Gracilibacteria bacterium]|nr:YggT family protein [Candidatus Gracilibacteria bacterium]
MQILLAIIIFLEIISYLIIFDVILSWLILFGLNLRPKFLADIIDPIYKNIRKIIPTTFGPLDFTPIVAIILIIFIKGALYIVFPNLLVEVSNLMN